LATGHCTRRALYHHHVLVPNNQLFESRGIDQNKLEYEFANRLQWSDRNNCPMLLRASGLDTIEKPVSCRCHRYFVNHSLRAWHRYIHLRARFTMVTDHCHGSVFTIEAFLLVEIDQFPKLIWVTSVGLGSAAACDIIIAVSLCSYLTRSRTGFKRTDSLITTLIVYSLTTGLVTSVIASAAVITFAIMPTNFIWMSFFWVLGKCYVNSFLAALNSRDALRERASPQDGTFWQISPFHATVPFQHSEGMAMTTATKTHPPLSVKVETSTISKMDCLESPASETSTKQITVAVAFGSGINPGPYQLHPHEECPNSSAASTSS